jgi:hypothetical protein
LKFSIWASGQSNYGLGRFHPEAVFGLKLPGQVKGCITVRLLEAVEILGITNQGVPEHVTAKFQITQVLVDDGGTTVIAIFSGT